MLGWIRTAFARITRLPRRVLFPMVAVMLTAATATALVAFAPEPDRRPVEDLAVPVTSLIAEPRTLSPELHLYGRVETPHRASLTALTRAAVESLCAREGDRVAAGDVLVQLDETDARLLVRQRESDLVETRSDLAALQLAGADDREVDLLALLKSYAPHRPISSASYSPNGGRHT